MSKYNEMKVPEIKEKLTELGIEFDRKMNKDELIEVLKDYTNNTINSEDDKKEDSSSGEAEQKKYVVVHDFKDLKEGNTIYIKGDIFPRRADTVVDQDRIEELSSTKNKIGKQLIEEQD